MVEVRQVEKKIPLTVLEAKVEDKIIQMVVESDTPLEYCLNGLQQFMDYVLEMKKNVEENQKEEDLNTPIEE